MQTNFQFCYCKPKWFHFDKLLKTISTLMIMMIMGWLLSLSNFNLIQPIKIYVTIMLINRVNKIQKKKKKYLVQMTRTRTRIFCLLFPLLIKRERYKQNMMMLFACIIQDFRFSVVLVVFFYFNFQCWFSKFCPFFVLFIVVCVCLSPLFLIVVVVFFCKL